MKKIGIYMITNKVSNKKYIGSSRNIEQRKRTHLHKLRHGKHENAHLQNAFNKYGEENFEFSILEECLKENLAQKEKKNIEEWETLCRDKGYNICPNINNKWFHIPAELASQIAFDTENISIFLFIFFNASSENVSTPHRNWMHPACFNSGKYSLSVSSGI